MSDTSPRSLGIGKVIRLSFGVVVAHPVMFGLLSFIFAGLPTLIFGFAEWLAPAAVARALPGPDWLIGFFIGMVSATVLQAALIRATLQHLNGQRVGFGTALSAGIRNLPRLVLLSLLTTAAIVAGIIVLVFPGLILATIWAVAGPALVVEGVSVPKALSRSVYLTRGNAWRVFGLLLILIVATIALTVGATKGADMVTDFPYEDYEVLFRLGIDAVSGTIQSLFSAVSAAVLYFELRRIKEGVGVEQLASVFD